MLHVNTMVVKFVRTLPTQMFFTVIFYIYYAAIFGLCIVPSLYIIG